MKDQKAVSISDVKPGLCRLQKVYWKRGDRVFFRKKEKADEVWINPKKTRSLDERETAVRAGRYEARRVPGHLDEFRIVNMGSRCGGDRDAGRTLCYARSREEAERIIRNLSKR